MLPTEGYYLEQIRHDPALVRAYENHVWQNHYDLRQINHLYLVHGTWVFDLQGDRLSFWYDSVNPSWNAPKLFLQPVSIDLSPKQSFDVYTAVLNAGIPQLRTTPCSLVNLEGGYMIADYLVCQFSFGGSFIFASQSSIRQLEKLAMVLKDCFREELSFQERLVFNDQFFSLDNHGLTVPDSPGLHLHLASRRRILSFRQKVVVIGTDPNATIVFSPGIGISRSQAVLRLRNGGWHITNYGQDGTVTLNGISVAFQCSRPLAQGDVIGLGSREFLTVCRIAR